MDLILYNGVITTLENDQPKAQAAGIKSGRFEIIGSDEEVLKTKDENTKMIDLKGAYVYPGFIDSHMHLADTAYLKTKLDLSGCRSFAEVKEALHKEALRIKSLGTDEWINGVNFNQNQWKDTNDLPTRLELDDVCEGIPCYILRCCGHVAVHSTKAMEVMGLMEEREGTLLKMSFLEDGTPSGQMFESDADPAEEYTDKPSLEDYKRWIKEETAHYASLGLVAIHSDDLNLVDPGKDAEMVMQAYREAAENGDMSIRVYEQCRIEEKELVEAFARKYPKGTAYGKNGMFKTVSFKEMMDGSLGAHSAYLRDGYKNDPSAANIAMHSDEEIYGLVKAANEGGYPVVAHCIGDAAVDQLLNAFETVKKEGGNDGSIRNGVVHCQIMGFDQLERMGKENILAYVQPVFVGTDAPIVEGCVGKEITMQSYNWRKMLDLGIHVSSGTDCPVESNDPINNFYYAVTRDGGDGTPWYEENAMTREEALKSLTIEGAYAAGEEEQRGTIRVGKFADLTILDQDLIEGEADQIRSTKVLMTIVDGEIRYMR